MKKEIFLCIGHRGAMGHRPENTLASVRKAIELGAPCVEIDVYFVDGHLVVFHDERLERTTNGEGLLMEQSFDYLRSLDAGDGERIPTLEEVCDAVDSRAGLNIELKGPDTAAPVAAFLEHLSRRGYPKGRFLVSSFARKELVEFRRCDPMVHLGVLIDAAPGDDLEFAAGIGAFSIHPEVEHVDRRFIEAAHASGLKVYVYTVDLPEDVGRMFWMGADGVFTNFPERVIETFRQPRVDRVWR